MQTEDGQHPQITESSKTTQDWPLVIAVDLGGTQLRVAVLRGAELLSRVGLLTGDDPRPERVLPRVYDMVAQALNEAGVTLDQIAGIGIGAPGPLDSRTGVVYDPPNMPGWNHIPLRDMFMERYHVPVYVENDANAAALGEYLFGAGRGYKDMVYLTVSTGIGGGVIVDGKILLGAKGTAGEIGHMTVDWHGERCTCGNIGCLESISSGIGIRRRANQLIRAGEGDELLAFARTQAQQEHANADTSTAQGTRDQHVKNESESEGQGDDGEVRVTARVVAQAAEAGVPVAQAIIKRAAEALGVGLVNTIHIFNPEIIILGGGVTQMGAMLMDPALRIVRERAMNVPRESVRIMLAQLGHNVGLVGAGSLIYYYAGARSIGTYVVPLSIFVL